jgi:Rhodanese-like domain
MCRLKKVTGNTTTDGPKHRYSQVLIILRDAIFATLLSAAVAVVVNLVHPNAISFVAKKEYEILVPCPEPGGEISQMNADDHAIFAHYTFCVDARAKEEFALWRFRKATNLTYDYLEATPVELIKELAGAIAGSRATKVMVYGDGEVPDTGEQLAKEISGAGIKNVFFLKGGAPALRMTKKPGGGK